jgi:hypothetical protein
MRRIVCLKDIRLVLETLDNTLQKQLLNQKLRKDTGIIFSKRLLFHEARFAYKRSTLYLDFLLLFLKTGPFREDEFLHMLSLDEPQSHYYQENIVIPLIIVLHLLYYTYCTSTIHLTYTLSGFRYSIAWSITLSRRKLKPSSKFIMANIYII